MRFSLCRALARLYADWQLIIDDEASGMGIREDNTPINKDTSRFLLSHIILPVNHTFVIQPGVTGAVKRPYLDFSAIEGGRHHNLANTYRF